MRDSRFFFIAIVLFFGSSLQLTLAQVMPPNDFLPHTFGEEFTPHHRLVDYFDHVSQESPRVLVKSYGKTNQNRPLIYAIITSERNHKIIEEIRKNNLRRAGIENGKAIELYDKSIIWLSFGVHGNEAGASESAIQTLHELASRQDPSTLDWLDNTVVIIDPCLNPDGYNRYTNWQINITGQYKNPSYADNSHMEPWPSGRVNHYHHDLNRDWAWATQVETQQRLEIYHKWLPHIHADFHEMFPESPYYFAPAAEPYHAYISDFQRAFQITVGKNHAGHFDKNDWLYYTREEFDLFYPSYGDTYPTFNGAIGMTYEQAGHGVASHAIKLENGDTLTLQDRIDHHTVTALSTIEAANNGKSELIDAFELYFSSAREKPLGTYYSYIVKNDGSEALQSFLSLLDRHRINYGVASQDGEVNGFIYKKFENGKFNFNAGDIIIPAKQSHGTMVQVLLEPKSKLADSVTYDITAWSLLFAYGLEAAATSRDLAFQSYKPKAVSSSTLPDAYAYILSYSDNSSGYLTSQLLRAGIKLRVAHKPFTNSGYNFEKGSIIITRADNKANDLVEILSRLTKGVDVNMISVNTGFSEKGPDIGSDQMKLMTTPDVLLVGGQGTDQYNYGQIWHFLDEKIQLPYTTTLASNFNTKKIETYNTIILPDGYYPRLNEHMLGDLKDWVRNGGKLIAFGSAISAISGEKGFPFELKKNMDTPKKETESGDHKLERFEKVFRKDVSNWMPGAIVNLNIDDSHPLGFGIGKTYASLKLSTKGIPYQKNTWNVAFINDELNYTGFIGQHVKEKLNNTTTFFVKDMGRGTVIGLVDNPLYRSFWHRGERILYNALFIVN